MNNNSSLSWVPDDLGLNSLKWHHFWELPQTNLLDMFEVAGKNNIFPEVQPINALLSIWCTRSGITIFSKHVHWQNPHFFIFVIELGKVITLRDSQSMKRHSSMVSILGRSTLANFINPRNAPDSISITPGGILILSRPLDKNSYFFMHLSY